MLVIVVLTLCGIVIAAPAVSAQEHGSRHRQSAEMLALRLMVEIPDGSEVALRPFRLVDGNILPDEIGQEIYNTLTQALGNAKRTVKVMSRRLHDIYETFQDHQRDKSIDDLLREVLADIEILCQTSRDGEGVTLSCEAPNLETGVNMGKGGSVHFRLDRPQMFDLLIFELAEKIASKATGELAEVTFTERQTGCGSPLGDYLSARLEEYVIDWTERRALQRWQAIAGDGATAQSYDLAGVIWRHSDEAVELTLRLMAGEKKLTTVNEEIAVSALPPRLAAPPPPDCRNGEHEGVAQAVVSEHLDRASAARATRNLARARVIARALGLPAPAVGEVTSESDAVDVLANSLLDEGLTVQERFSVMGGSDENRLATRVAARVVPVGSRMRPAVTATLDQSRYRARQEPISIRISSEDTVYLGIFSWGADDRVMRLYPAASTPLQARAGESLDLPRPGEGYLLSAPMPGNAEDHEALVVVGTPEPVDLSAIAPVISETPGDSPDGSKTSGDPPDGAAFIAALARLDPQRMAIIVLPYRVYDSQVDLLSTRRGS